MSPAAAPTVTTSFESLVVFVDVADELVGAIRQAPTELTSSTGPFAAAAGSGDSNLVMRAVKAFRTRWPGRLPDGLDIALTKNLPAGGRRNRRRLRRCSRYAAPAVRAWREGEYQTCRAAATLRADAWCGRARLSAVAALARCAAWARSSTRYARSPATHLVLVNPLVPVVTGRRVPSPRKPTRTPTPSRVPRPLTRPAQLGLWLAETRNDLEPAAIALVPVIGDLLRDMRTLDGCALARMSGSGGTSLRPVRLSRPVPTRPRTICGQNTRELLGRGGAGDGWLETTTAPEGAAAKLDPLPA